MSSSHTISTPLTRALNIKYPIMLAGMNKASGAKLAAAVTNAGGIGVIGGLGFSPRLLRITIKNIKKDLIDKQASFGVDLPLPQIGDGARKTNYDYQKGKLSALIDIIIEEKAKLFVSAIGVPTKATVDKLHANHILVMNMIGHPKHVKKALAVGVDILCCQGTEGGGHTGDIASSILLPSVLGIVARAQYRSPLTHEPVYVVGAGGIYNGKGLAMSLVAGAQAVWVGTRFVCSVESGATQAHKLDICNAGFDDTFTSEVYSGRPLRMIKNEYALNWELNRKQEMNDLLNDGQVPFTVDIDKKTGKILQPQHLQNLKDFVPHLSGQCAGPITEILTAKQIVDRMMAEAMELIRNSYATLGPMQSKL